MLIDLCVILYCVVKQVWLLKAWPMQDNWLLPLRFDALT